MQARATPSRRRLALGVAATIVSLAAATGLVFYGLRRVEKMGGRPETWAARGKPVPWNDFRVYVEAAARVRDDPALYERTLTPDGRRYLYPPLLATLLQPLAKTSTTTAATLWYVAGLVAMGVGAVAAAAAVAGRGAPRRDVLLALGAGALLTVPFFDDDFRNSNANGLVFAATSLGALGYVRGRPFAGGVAFGAAVALKVTPLLVLPWLLLRRAWRESAALLAGLALWFVVVPSVLVGPARNLSLLRDWATAFAAPWLGATVRPDDGGGPPGWSLRAVLVRTLSSEAWPEKWNEPRIRLASLDPSVVRALVAAASFAVLAVTAWAWRRRRDEPALDRDLAPLHLSLVLCAALLVSPVTFRAHLVALFLPAAALATWWRRSRGTSAGARRVVLGLLAFAVLLNPATDIGIVSRRVAGIEFALGVLFLSPLALWVASLVAVRSVRRGRRALTVP
jgi:hypothetical protein